MKMKKRGILLFLFFLAFTGLTFAHNATLYLFWGKGCPHCAAEKQFLSQIKSKYPELTIKEFEVYYNKTNYQLFKEFCEAYGTQPVGVPTTFIGNKYIIGFGDATKELLEKEIKNCIEKGCISPDEKVELYKKCQKRVENETQPIVHEFTNITVNVTKRSGVWKYVSELKSSNLLLLTLVIGFVDGLNPCTMAALMLLITLMIYGVTRERITRLDLLKVGFVFVLTVYWIYFGFMYGILSAFIAVRYTRWLKFVIGCVALIMGSINIKDFFAFGRGVSLVAPRRFQPKLHSLMRKAVKTASIPTTIVLAAFASLIELPCTAGFPVIYNAILAERVNSFVVRILYLLLYNIVYVLPLVAIILVTAYTLKSRKMTEKTGRILKLVGGIIMVCLAIPLMLNWL